MSISRISDSSYLYGLLGVQSVNQTQTGVSAADLLSSDSSESDQVKVSGLGSTLSKLQNLLSSDPDKFKEVTAKISADLATQAEATDDEAKSQMLSDMSARFAEASESGSMDALRPSAPPPPPPPVAAEEESEDSTTTAAEDSTTATSLTDLSETDDASLTAEDLESLLGMMARPHRHHGAKPTASADASTDETTASDATTSAESSAAASLADLLGTDDSSDALTAEELESLFDMAPPPPPPPGPRPTAAGAASETTTAASDATSTGSSTASTVASTTSTASSTTSTVASSSSSETGAAATDSTDETESLEELLRKSLASRAAMRKAIGQYARNSQSASSSEAESDLMDVFASINQIIASDLADATGGQSASVNLAA